MSASGVPDAAGFRETIDAAEVAGLAADNPNLAAAAGVYDHENHIGEPVDDDPALAAALAELDDGQA